MFTIGYIDPGLGGLIVQSLIAGFLTVLYFFRNSFSKLKGVIKSLFGQKKNDNDK